MFRLAVSAAVLVFATACTTTPSPEGATAAPAAATETAAPGPAAAPPTQPDCNAQAAREAVGQEATADVVERARSAAGAQSARVLKPGQMVTMEFNASRLNLDVDAGNVVTNVRCG